MDSVVLGLNDEGGRRLFGGMEVQVAEHGVFGVGEVAGIDDYGEVGAAALLVCCVDGVVEALFIVGAEGGSEMSAGGEAEDADAVGVDVPFCRVSADDTDGALGVLKGC